MGQNYSNKIGSSKIVMMKAFTSFISKTVLFDRLGDLAFEFLEAFFELITLSVTRQSRAFLDFGENFVTQRSRPDLLVYIC